MTHKNYLVVGGSSGIGLEIAKKLHEKGHKVWVASRTKQSLADLPGIEYLELDVLADDPDLSGLPETIHGLAYCPGTINLKPFRSLKTEDFRSDFEINVLGAVKVIHAIEKNLKKEGGSVVLFSTVAVGVGMPFHASVATAKGAIEGLARSLAAEYAPTVRFNCVAPSLTDTPLAAKLLSSDEKKEAAEKRHPLERVGTTYDIASLACFLLGEESSWITGQVIGADGGLSTLRT